MIHCCPGFIQRWRKKNWNPCGLLAACLKFQGDIQYFLDFFFTAMSHARDLIIWNVAIPEKKTRKISHDVFANFFSFYPYFLAMRFGILRISVPAKGFPVITIYITCSTLFGVQPLLLNQNYNYHPQPYWIYIQLNIYFDYCSPNTRLKNPQSRETLNGVDVWAYR